MVAKGKFVAVLSLVGVIAGAALAADLGTAFTYQGQLNLDGTPVNGPVDMRFEVYDDPNGVTPLASYPPAGTIAVPVTDGLFTQEIDFGAGAFAGDARWLQVYVGTPLIPLLPRQKLTPAPYALFSAAPWVTSGTDLSYLEGGVGIGTNAPTAKLHVSAPVTDHENGTLAVENTTNAPDAGAQFIVKSPNVTVQVFAWENLGARIGTRSSPNGPGHVYFTTDDQVQMSIFDSGNVGIGIGTNSPQERLHIGTGVTGAWDDTIQIGDYTAFGQMYGSGATVVGDNVKPADGAEGLVFMQDQANLNGGRAIVLQGSEGVVFHATGTGAVAGAPFSSEAMRILNNGNVGIGTSGPAEKLTVAGTVFSTTGGFKLPDGTIVDDAGDLGGAGAYWSANGNDIYNTNAGNVGIGMPSPEARLDVAATYEAIMGHSANAAAVTGSSASSFGVQGLSGNGIGVEGESTNSAGVHGLSTNNTGVWGECNNAGYSGVAGINQGPGNGVYGRSDGGGTGVEGVSTTSFGVQGLSTDGIAVEGASTNSVGVRGWSANNTGVLGECASSDPGHSAVAGINQGPGNGVYGRSDGGGFAGYFDGEGYFAGNVGIGYADPQAKLHVFSASDTSKAITAQSQGALTGVFWSIGPAEAANVGVLGSTAGQAYYLPNSGVNGYSEAGRGVTGISTSGQGVIGFSTSGDGMVAQSSGEHKSGIYALNDASTGTTWGVFGQVLSPDGYAGYFEGRGYFGGNVGIGTLSPAAKLDVAGTTRTQVLEITGADVAERFPISDNVEPGMVVEIDPDNAGQLRRASGAYNRRVAGVVSGAGGLSAGAILGNLPESKDGPPIAMSGRVWVYCDATTDAIQPGDLLTTADTPGHAMKVTDYSRAQGATVGKAMTTLKAGTKGLVLVLVHTQ